MAGGLLVLLGLIGMAYDLGLVRNTKRQMQTAADAAAIAAAEVLPDGDYTTAATQAATQNGFTNGSPTALSTYNVSVTAAVPAAGPYAANANAIQVTISQVQPTYFLQMLGITSLSVSASAVGLAKNGTACIYALNPTGNETIYMNGNINVTSACGILDDSTSSTGIDVNGNITISDSYTGVVGNYSANGNISITPSIKTGIPAFADPLADITAPTVPTCSDALTNKSGSLSITSTQTVQPGVYPSGISISGNFGTVTFAGGGNYGNAISASGNGSVVLNPGQYQNGGGSGNSFSLNGNTTVTMNPGQYTFCGPVNLNGNTSTATFSPGYYYGGISINGNQAIAFNPGTYILGGGGLSINGNTPTMTGTGVTFYDTTGLGGYGPIKLNGNTQINLSAPTTGSLAAMLFFQDRSIPTTGPASLINGNSSSTFNGAIYFPTTDITYNGNSALNGYTILVAYGITWNGNSNIGNNYTSLADGSPIKAGSLVQ